MSVFEIKCRDYPEEMTASFERESDGSFHLSMDQPGDSYHCCATCGRPSNDHNVRHPFIHKDDVRGAYMTIGGDDADQLSEFLRGVPEMKKTDLHPSVEGLLRFFAYEHLPEKPKAVSRPFCLLAQEIAHVLPDGAEKTVAPRKLLEAKDCAVRSIL